MQHVCFQMFRPCLPEYLVDFGHVVLGMTCLKKINATNTGWVPASFSINRLSQRELKQHGFHIELPKVVHLPGAPEHETLEFILAFDPRGANLEEGPVEKVVTINVCIELFYF